MQKEMHPEMKRVIVRCACGAEYETTSTEDNLRVEICSNCHPFYTGKKKIVDSGGRVERFKRKYEGLYEEDEEDEEDEEGKEVGEVEQGQGVQEGEEAEDVEEDGGVEGEREAEGASA